MVTCIQCGTALREGESTCGRCGASATPAKEDIEGAPPASAEDGAAVSATSSSSGEHAPVGTWSEDTGEVDVTAARTEPSPRAEDGARPGTDPEPEAERVLRFGETPQATEQRPDAPPLRPERIVRDPDLTPVPGLAVALAAQPNPHREAEATGSRPTLKDRPMGQVVPLRRDPQATPVEAPPSAAPAAEAGGAPEPASVQAPAASAAPEPRPPEAPEPTAESSRDASISRSETGAKRPPVLASESLREDLTPTEPGRGRIRWVSAFIGVVGAGATIALAATSPFAWVVATLLLGCAALGLAPIRYEARAVAITALSISGLIVVIVATGLDAVPPVLAVAMVVLSAGLLFRGTYRASSVARVLAGVGLGLGLIWFIGSGTISGLSVMDTTWQSVASAVVRLAFLLLLLVSLLAFMDASTTAGGRVIGTAVLVWYGVFVMLELSVRVWPAPGHPVDGPDGLFARMLDGGVGPPDALTMAMTVGGAALVALSGYALSHLLVALAGGTVPRREAQARLDDAGQSHA